MFMSFARYGADILADVLGNLQNDGTLNGANRVILSEFYRTRRHFDVIPGSRHTTMDNLLLSACTKLIQKVVYDVSVSNFELSKDKAKERFATPSPTPPTTSNRTPAAVNAYCDL